MTVQQLIEALKRCNSPSAKVTAWKADGDDGEFDVHVVTIGRGGRSLVMNSDPSEISVSETVLHSDAKEE